MRKTTYPLISAHFFLRRLPRSALLRFLEPTSICRHAVCKTITLGTGSLRLLSPCFRMLRMNACPLASMLIFAAAPPLWTFASQSICHRRVVIHACKLTSPPVDQELPGKISMAFSAKTSPSVARLACPSPSQIGNRGHGSSP